MKHKSVVVPLGICALFFTVAVRLSTAATAPLPEWLQQQAPQQFNFPQEVPQQQQFLQASDIQQVRQQSPDAQTNFNALRQSNPPTAGGQPPTAGQLPTVDVPPTNEPATPANPNALCKDSGTCKDCHDATVEGGCTWCGTYTVYNLTSIIKEYENGACMPTPKKATACGTNVWGTMEAFALISKDQFLLTPHFEYNPGCARDPTEDVPYVHTEATVASQPECLAIDGHGWCEMSAHYDDTNITDTRTGGWCTLPSPGSATHCKHPKLQTLLEFPFQEHGSYWSIDYKWTPPLTTSTTAAPTPRPGETPTRKPNTDKQPSAAKMLYAPAWWVLASSIVLTWERMWIHS